MASLRRGRERWAADERILGSGAFVEAVLREVTPPSPPWAPAKSLAALPTVVAACAKAWGVSPNEIGGGSRRRPVAQARTAASFLAVTKLGLPAAAVARALRVTPAVVLRGVVRGPRLFEARRVDPSGLLTQPNRKV